MNGGGYGNLGYQAILCDIWVLNGVSLQWYWVRGEESVSSTGSFGVKSVTSVSSFPPGRCSGSFSSIATVGRLVVFGGGGATRNDNFNDIWYLDLRNISNTITSTLLSAQSSTASVLPTVVSSSISVTTQLPSSTAHTSSAIVTLSISSELSSSAIVTLSISSELSSAETQSVTATLAPSELPVLAKPSTITGNFLLFLVLIAIVCVCILILAGLCLWKCRQSRRSKKNQNVEQSDSTTISTYVSIESTTSMGMTMINDKTEFAVPGFLQFKAGAEFRWHKSIAKGGGGEVFLGDALIPRLQEFGPTIIVKVASKSRGSLELCLSQAFDQEISVMHLLGRHKNIARLLGWCEEPVSMLMKYYKLGALDHFIKNGKVFSKGLKLDFMLDVARGLSFMHSKKVAHCDIKPANILVDADRNGRLFCALTDFGISQVYSQNANLVHSFKVINLRGASIAFAAPEVVTRFRTRTDCSMELAFAGDVYSSGMIVFALLNTTEGWK